MLNYYQILALCLLEAGLIGILLRERHRRHLGQQKLDERLRFEHLGVPAWPPRLGSFTAT